MREGFRVTCAGCLVSLVSMSAACVNVYDLTDGCVDDADCRYGRVCAPEGVCAWPAGATNDSMEGGGQSPLAPDMDVSISGDMPGDGGGSGVQEDLGPVVTGDFCVAFDPPVLDFGNVPVGETRVERVQVSNCSGSKTFFVQDFRLTSALPEYSLSAWSIGTAPFGLVPGGDAFIEVEYSPSEPGRDQDEFALIVTERGNGGERGSAILTIDGEGGIEPADNRCPVAVATGEPVDGSLSAQKTFDEFPAGEILLDGSLSYERDDGDSIQRYVWTIVEEPPGAGVDIAGRDEPKALAPLFVPGNYLFRLSVFDRWGRESCSFAEVRVNVQGG